MLKIVITKIIIAAVFISMPLQMTFARDQNLLDPNRWVESFKHIITIPFSGPLNIPFTVPQGGEKLPTPEEALKKFSPQLQEINRGVQEETGVDFAKFLRWITKVFTVIFRITTTILETFAGALAS